jgi:hypothetical protein
LSSKSARIRRRRSPDSPPRPRSIGAQYVADHRRRHRQGRAQIKVEIEAAPTIETLIRTGKLTGERALDERAVARVLEQIIRDALSKL